MKEDPNVVMERMDMALDMADGIAASLEENGVTPEAARKISRFALFGQLAMAVVQSFPDGEVTAEDINEAFTDVRMDNLLDRIINE